MSYISLNFPYEKSFSNYNGVCPNEIHCSYLCTNTFVLLLLILGKIKPVSSSTKWNRAPMRSTFENFFLKCWTEPLQWTFHCCGQDWSVNWTIMIDDLLSLVIWSTIQFLCQFVMCISSVHCYSYGNKPMQSIKLCAASTKEYLWFWFWWAHKMD